MSATHDLPVTRSLIPARIDRLPWSPFHTRMVVALGTAWLLDGLEVTIASNVADTLSQPARLGLSTAAVGGLATAYLIGQVIGALVFGQIADRVGRRPLFIITLIVYFAGSGLIVFTPGHGAVAVVFVYLTRVIAGAGIGGEYAAINSAVDELVPAPYRGRVDIAVNGTYWAGAAVAAAVQVPLLSGALSPDLDWRLAFLLGPVLALIILLVRRNLPESPRWQLMNGHTVAAEESLTRIEREVEAAGNPLPPLDQERAIAVRPGGSNGFVELLVALFRESPDRSILGATLMITQSFLYNAIFFTYASVLSAFFGVQNTALYYIPFAVGNLLGPLVLGRLFDTIGRRTMISGTYAISGVLLVGSALLFRAGVLTATSQTILWCIVFFFASAGASAAYLTVSEIFPVEVRAKAIAVFFAIAQGFGSVAPLFYGLLIDKNHPDPSRLFIGYIVGAVIMIIGAVVELKLGVDAERKPLEDVARSHRVISPHELDGPR